MKALRCTSTLFLDIGTRRGWGVSLTPRPLSTPGKDPVPIVQETGWAPGSVWTGAENLAPTRIRSPYHPASIQSLYLLIYPAQELLVWYVNNNTLDWECQTHCRSLTLRCRDRRYISDVGALYEAVVKTLFLWSDQCMVQLRGSVKSILNTLKWK
jgi:hypothetical protein